MSEPKPDERREVLYEGTVQGVGFRYTSRRIAARFGVTGYVKNLSDGRVQLVAEGSTEELDRFFAAIRAELGYYITGTRETVEPAGHQFRQFEVRF